MAGVKGRSGGARPGCGRPAFSPTQEQRKLVEQLSAFGIRVDEMPAFITDRASKPIGRKTLTKHFKNEIEAGRLKANVKVANALYRNATEPSNSAPHGNIAAQIFWLKTRCGWSESQPAIASVRASGGVLVVPAGMAVDQWEALAAPENKP